MSILIGNEAFRVGLEIHKEELLSAVERYSDYLYVYGTTPDMSKVEKLKEIINTINEEGE